MNGYLVIVIAILISINFGCSETAINSQNQNAKVARYFDNLVEDRDFSGVILIGNNNEIITTYVSGYSDFANKVEHTIDSKFGIASISKTLTAAAILQLKNKGEIQLSDKIGKYLPEFKFGDKITILNLLRHESGLQDVDYEIKELLNSKQLVSELETDTLFFEPGTNGRYSNAGFIVLARIVEVVSGISYEEYLRSKLLWPENIMNTGDLSTLKIPEKFSNPNFPSPGPEYIESISNINYSLFLGSGSLYSTATDLWKWGNSILSKSQVDVFKEDYPYGWGRDSIAGKFSLNQTGMNKGVVSSLFLFPNEDIVIVLLSNIENGLWVDWTKDVAKMHFLDSPKINYPRKRIHRLEPIRNLDQWKGMYKLNKDRMVEIKNINNNLFMHLNGDHQGHHLTPIENDSFELRSFTGKVTFKGDTLLWKLPKAWGGNSDFYIKH